MSSEAAQLAETAHRAHRRIPALLSVAVTVGMVGAVGGLGTGTALAGGTPAASCPSNEIATVSVSPDVDPYAGAPQRVDAGYYAHVSSFWPPFSKNLCETVPASDHPQVKLGGTGCPARTVPLQVPNVIPPAFDQSPAVTWGTFLPGGWYVLGGDSDGWSTLCWTGVPPTPAVPPV